MIALVIAIVYTESKNEEKPEGISWKKEGGTVYHYIIPYFMNSTYMNSAQLEWLSLQMMFLEDAILMLCWVDKNTSIIMKRWFHNSLKYEHALHLTSFCSSLLLRWKYDCKDTKYQAAAATVQYWEKHPIFWWDYPVSSRWLHYMNTCILLLIWWFSIGRVWWWKVHIFCFS